MKTLIKGLLIFMGITSLLILGYMFIYWQPWDYNPGNWDHKARAAALLYTFILGLLINFYLKGWYDY